VVISALILLVTNFAGVLMFSTDMSRRIKRRRRARRRFGAAAAATNGSSVPSRESLITLIRVGTPYDEVVARFGRPDEEHERVTPPGRRTVIYRAANDGEQHEVAIELRDNRVTEVTCITSR
jgi:PDZ domain-containing secreted protein